MATRKILVCFLMITLLVLFEFSIQGMAAEQKPITLRLAHMYPDQNPVGLAATLFSKLVEERTKGKVKIHIFSSGQLGGDVENRDAVMAGTLDFSLNAVPSFSAYVPEIAMTDLPYFWRNSDHYLKFWNSPLGKEWISHYEAATKIKILAVNWLMAERHILAKKPVRTPDDLKGVKLRTSPGFQHHYDGFLAMGATPVFLSFQEVYSALQQGVVDAMENPLVEIYASKFHEICKYVSLTGHIFNSRAVHIGRGVWEKLDPETQAIMIKAANEAGEYHMALQGLAEVKGEKSPVEEVMEKMKKEGVTFVQPNVALFREKVLKEAHPKYIGKYKNGQALYDQIQAVK